VALDRVPGTGVDLDRVIDLSEEDDPDHGARR